MLCSQDSGSSCSSDVFESSGFIPESEFDSIPESKLVIDDSEVVLNDVFGCSDLVSNLFVLESPGNKLNDAALSLAWDSLSVTFASKHNCLRYKSVASFTRLIPLVMPNRRNNRLKCAFTVRRAMLSCRAISSLSQPCNNSSTICCSRCPRRMGLSLIEIPLKCAFVIELRLQRSSSAEGTSRTFTMSCSELLTEIHSTPFAN